MTTVDKNTTIYESADVFEQYLKAAKEKEFFAAALLEGFGASEKPLAILDLGTNDGGLTLLYASKLPAGSEIICVEPSIDAITRFKSRELPKGISFHFINQTADAYLQKCERRFDWVIASHSLYWCHSLTQTIESISKISDNSAIAIRDAGGLYEIENKLWPLVRTERGPMYFAGDVVTALEKSNSKICKLIFETSIPIPNPNSDAFKLLSSFFLDTEPGKINAQVLREVQSYVEPFGNHFPFSIAMFFSEHGQRLE